VVYNACKAYAGQLREAERYTQLTDVVAISICDFELWPDAEQRAHDLPLVPMLSRWNMTERKSGNHGLLQVQYVFLELPKLPAPQPQNPGADLWAWLFVHAPQLTAVPPNLSAGPYRAALELANKATFTQGELDAYRRVIDEIHQAQELAEAKWAAGLAEGRAEGQIAGQITGKRDSLLRLLRRAELRLTPAEQERIATCMDLATLDRWFDNALAAKTVADVFS
jgi:hypothetical protein